MHTATMLCPADHGQQVSRADFDAASGQEGYRYELIHGRVYVSPQPALTHDRVSEWLYGRLYDYGRHNSHVFNYLTTRARVVVPAGLAPTVPEPDLAAYRDFPRHLPLDEVAWDDVQPLFVVEILSDDDREKDLVRNVGLYLLVPSIREYWVFDPSAGEDEPFLRVYRRRGSRWQKTIELTWDETYTTKLLPDFVLRLDPLS